MGLPMSRAVPRLAFRASAVPTCPRVAWSRTEPSCGSRFRQCRAARTTDRADPASGEVLLEVEQSLPNHNGGSTLASRAGGYLSGDYVAGTLWLLRPHADPRQTTNAVVPWNGLPAFGLGQDDAGDVYVLTSSPTGQGVYRLVAADQK